MSVPWHRRSLAGWEFRLHAQLEQTTVSGLGWLQLLPPHHEALHPLVVGLAQDP